MEYGGPLERWPYAMLDPDRYNEELYTNLAANTGHANDTHPLECVRLLAFDDFNSGLNITDTWILGTGVGPWTSIIDGDCLQNYQNT